MDFYGIIKQINELRNELRQVSLSAIEKDILKTKIAETYLLLFDEDTDAPKHATIPAQDCVQSLDSRHCEQSEAIQNIVMSQTHNDHEIASGYRPRNDGVIDALHTSQQPTEQDFPQKKPSDIDYKSLVDTFLEKEPAKPSPTEDNSLLSRMSQAKIVDLKRSIAMNDRFIFIKELFKNDFEAYNRYINDLNGCESMAQAEQYLSQLQTQYQWEEGNETVQYFLSLVGRKFC